MTGIGGLLRVEKALRAAHASQERLNIFTSIDDSAVARAKEIDAAVDRGQAPGPLAGIPIGLKDLIDQAGTTNTCGSAFYRHRPDVSARAVTALEEAGGVVIGRTGLHEWAFGFSSENPHWGPVRNPWDPDTSTGGSSGGSAAAVAAGITPIAIGTDTGGSVRVPAALCGTYGLKVTFGRIPLDGVFPLVSSIDTVGPLADSVAGIESSYRVMSGDTTPIPGTRTLRLGIPQPWYEDSPTAEDVATDFENAVTALRALGHEVHPIEMPDVLPGTQLWNAIAAEVREVHRAFRARNETYGDDVAKRLDDADLVTDEETAVAKEWQEMVRTRFGDALRTVDFLITPTVPVRRKVIGETGIGGRHYRSVVSYFSAIVNHSLHPAMALPLAGAGEPPASLQVIGSRHGESSLIGFAGVLESAGIVAFKPAPTNSPTPAAE